MRARPEKQVQWGMNMFPARKAVILPCMPMNSTFPCMYFSSYFPPKERASQDMHAPRKRRTEIAVFKKVVILSSWLERSYLLNRINAGFVHLGHQCLLNSSALISLWLKAFEFFSSTSLPGAAYRGT